MKVKGPGSPLSSGAEPLEPLDPKELQKALKGERFSAALSQLEAQASAGHTEGAGNPTRAALEKIARDANLSTGEGATSAVRESARFMIRTRLHEKFLQSDEGDNLVEGLSEFVTSDPLLKAKLLGILQRLKTA
jgi:hypothetical protein